MRLEQAGIHAVQAVSTCLSDSNRLSQSLRILMDDPAMRGVVSREHSVASESGEFALFLVIGEGVLFEWVIDNSVQQLRRRKSPT